MLNFIYMFYLVFNIRGEIMLKERKNAQSAIEFAALFGFVLFFFVTFFAIIQSNQSDKYKEKERILVQDVGLGIKEEIDLAAESSDGYFREFNVPQNILGIDYEINIEDSLLYLSSENAWSSYQIPNVTGTIQKGLNNISKQNGSVFIN